MNKDFQHKIDFFECSKESNYIPLLAWVLECAQDDYKDVYPILSEYSRFMLWKLMGIPMQDDTKVVLVHHTTNTGSMDLVMEAECETNGCKEKYIAAIEFRKYLSDRLSNTVVENMQKSIVGVDNEQYTRRELNILCVDSQSVTYKECINALRLSAPNINVYTMSELIAPWMQGKPSEKEAFNELVLDVYSPFASAKMQEDVYYVPYNEIQPTPLPCYGSMDVPLQEKDTLSLINPTCEKFELILSDDPQKIDQIERTMMSAYTMSIKALVDFIRDNSDERGQRYFSYFDFGDNRKHTILYNMLISRFPSLGAIKRDTFRKTFSRVPK